NRNSRNGGLCLVPNLHYLRCLDRPCLLRGVWLEWHHGGQSTFHFSGGLMVYNEFDGWGGSCTGLQPDHSLSRESGQRSFASVGQRQYRRGREGRCRNERG